MAINDSNNVTTSEDSPKASISHKFYPEKMPRIATRGVMISALDPDLESDFQLFLFGDS